MTTIISIILTLLVFTIIVTIHEAGHFVMARKMGIFVNEFSIGMGPAIYQRKTKKDMVFSVRILPIGGFCSMKGEEVKEDTIIEEDSFTAKKPWQRALVVAAGPVMNFILAFIVLVIITVSYGYVDAKIVKSEEDYPAYEAGLREGDRILELNGEKIHTYDKVTFLMMFADPSEKVSLKVKSEEGEVKDLSFYLKYDEAAERYRMGFSCAGTGSYKQMIKDFGFFSATGRVIKESFYELTFEIEMTIRSIGMLITGQVGMDALTGPIGIVSVVSDTYTEAKSYGVMAVISSMASLMVLISANLGVLNLFPIPGLDGSRLVFFLIEAIRKKPINPKVENFIYLIGFILLFGLMILVAFNDVLRLIR